MTARHRSANALFLSGSGCRSARHAWLGAPLLFLAFAACGGGASKPAESAVDPVIATGTTPAPLPPSLGPVAPPPASAAQTAPPSEDVARGTKALEANDFTSARALFEGAMKKNPSDADAAYYLGLTREKQGDRADAEKGYREALKRKADHEAAAVNLSALLVDASKHDDAATVARGALAKHADNGSLRLNLAVALAGKGDSAGASKEFDEVLRRHGKEPLFHLTYGHWLATWKEKDAAVRELTAARSLAGDDVGVLASVGHELRLVGAFPECIAALGRAIEHQDAAELRTERALCKIGAKDDAGALADLEAAVAKEPKFAPGRFYLGGRYAAAGKWKDVIAEYETYLKLAPDGPLAAQASERVRVAKERLKK